MRRAHACVMQAASLRGGLSFGRVPACAPAHAAFMPRKAKCSLFAADSTAA